MPPEIGDPADPTGADQRIRAMKAVSWRETDAPAASFLAVVPPPHVIEPIEEAQRAAGVDPDVLAHVTVKAQPGLHEPQRWRAPIAAALGQYPAFDMALGRPDRFGDDMLYLTVDSKAIIDLHWAILGCLADLGTTERFEYDAEHFIPHLTVAAAWASGGSADLSALAARLDAVDLPPFVVTEIIEFHRSEPGAPYEPLTTFVLCSRGIVRC